MIGTQQEPPTRVPDSGGRRAIVVGASSGVGAALARRLAAEGWQVVGLARRAAELATLAGEAGGSVSTVVHDVRDTAAVPELFERLVRELGGLDLLVYSAGTMPKVAPSEYDTVKDLDILAVNFSGLVAWGNAAAAFFGSRRSGTLVGLSSISGDRGRKGNPLYGASKAAMDNYLESLRNRLAGLGVGVVTIKPGYVATRMTAGMDGLFWVITPEQAAEAILQAVREGAGVRYVPRRWWCVAQVVKLIPSFLFKRLDFLMGVAGTRPAAGAGGPLRDGESAGNGGPAHGREPLRSWESVEGWGMCVAAPSRVLRPRSVEELAEAFAIARRDGVCLGLRGTGNSYGDASVNALGHVLDCSRMNRILDWNPETGIAVLEPGVTVGQLWKRILPDGWWLHLAW